jgi:hypothetical protein
MEDILIGKGDDWPTDYYHGFDGPMAVITAIGRRNLSICWPEVLPGRRMPRVCWPASNRWIAHLPSLIFEVLSDGRVIARTPTLQPHSGSYGGVAAARAAGPRRRRRSAPRNARGGTIGARAHLINVIPAQARIQEGLIALGCASGNDSLRLDQSFARLRNLALQLAIVQWSVPEPACMHAETSASGCRSWASR